ncbi:hypothetical protein J7X40_002317 [Vibrio parahaemolyticus]|nr:hypothetical protein [Vibrio parahaemolyticus]
MTELRSHLRRRISIQAKILKKELNLTHIDALKLLATVIYQSDSYQLLYHNPHQYVDTWVGYHLMRNDSWVGMPLRGNSGGHLESSVLHHSLLSIPALAKQLSVQASVSFKDAFRLVCKIMQLDSYCFEENQSMTRSLGWAHAYEAERDYFNAFLRSLNEIYTYAGNDYVLIRKSDSQYDWKNFRLPIFTYKYQYKTRLHLSSCLEMFPDFGAHDGEMDMIEDSAYCTANDNQFCDVISVNDRAALVVLEKTTLFYLLIALSKNKGWSGPNSDFGYLHEEKLAEVDPVEVNKTLKSHRVLRKTFDKHLKEQNLSFTSREKRNSLFGIY